MKRVLVTGANRGIGFAVANAFASRGDRVVLACRSAKDGEDAAARIGKQSLPVTLDVADPASIAKAHATLANQGIDIDILINNAGIYQEGGALDLEPALFRASLEVNLLGPLLICQAFIPSMIRRGWGRVVNISSGYGSFAQGLEGPTAYSVAKAALNALTVKLAAEAGPKVLVNAVSPGWVRTRMGGPDADLSPEQSAERIVWAATLPDGGPTGKFLGDRRELAW